MLLGTRQAGKSRQIIYRAALFVLPLLLPIIFAEISFIVAGESVPISTVIRDQERHPNAIFLRQFFDQGHCAYKFQLLKRFHPRVVALGSSRVGKLRSEMFGEPPGAFINASKLISSVEDLEDYVAAFEGEYPEVILLGLDVWWFNPAWSSSASFSRESQSEAAFMWHAHLAALRASLSRPAFSKLWHAVRQSSDLTIGILAANSKMGYRIDGSVQTRFETPPLTQWRFIDRALDDPVPLLDRMRKSLDPFKPARAMSQARLERLSRCLDRLQKRGVQIVAFLPPVSHEAYQMLSEMPAHKGLWFDYKDTLKNVFIQRRIPFCDATSLATVGLDDNYLSDAHHPEETFYLHLLRILLKDSRVVAALPKAREPIEKALKNPRTNSFYPCFD